MAGKQERAGGGEPLRDLVAVPHQPGPMLAPRLAASILAAVFIAIGVASFLSVAMAAHGTVQIAASTLYLVALLVLQLGYLSREVALRHRRWTYAALAAQAALVYLPIQQFGATWIGLPGLLAGSLLLTLPTRVGVTLAAAVVASVAVLGARQGLGAVDVVHLIISVGITGLVTYGLTRLTLLVRQLQDAREELARLAVVQERLRFSRDVHDLLGLSLSAITLKSELVGRLITDRPDQAREEIGDIMQMSRRALADARSVASGSSLLSLAEECRLARSVLETAQVEPRMDVGVTVPGAVGSALASLLREGVTNVLRHSKAEWCAVTVRVDGGLNASMEIVNDGVSRSPDAALDSGTGGSGLRNLRQRVAELGGSLEAGPIPDDRYRLYAVVPLDVAPA